MNAKTRKLITLVTIALTFCLFAPEQSILAQTNCHKVEGNLKEVSSSTGTTGAITNGGIINGTTELVFTSDILPTPDPTTVSFTDDVTITTFHGQLKTGNVGIFDGGIGVFSEIGRINPNTSTGIFAGATGVLFTNGRTSDGGATFQSKIAGEICFAN